MTGKRLIDADTLKEIALKRGYSVRIDKHTGRWPCLLVADIANVPTVDAVEVVHGRWEYEPETLYTKAGYLCSACSGPLWNSPDVPQAFKFCPNCGAKMDGGFCNGQTD